MESWADDEIEVATPKPTKDTASSTSASTSNVKSQPDQKSHKASDRWRKRAEEGRKALVQERTRQQELTQLQRQRQHREKPGSNRYGNREDESHGVWARTTYANKGIAGPGTKAGSSALSGNQTSPNKDKDRNEDADADADNKVKNEDEDEDEDADADTDADIPKLASVAKSSSRQSSNKMETLNSTVRERQNSENFQQSKPKSEDSKQPAKSVSEYLQKRKQVGKALIKERFGFGYITALKESFGFIKCESQDLVSEVYFHFTELKDTEESSLHVGDELEFRIESKGNNRLNALEVKKLTRGTIKLDEDIPGKDRMQGIVVREHTKYSRSAQKSRRRSNSGSSDSSESLFGRIIIVAQENKELLNTLRPKLNPDAKVDAETIIAFGKRGVPPGKHLTPRVGDLVSFRAVRERRTGVLHAAGIRIKKMERDRIDDIISYSVERSTSERGTICALALESKSSSPNATGSIRKSDTQDQIDFRYKDFPDAMARKGDQFWKKNTDRRDRVRLRVGLDVEFFAVPDPCDSSKQIAVRIKLLEQEQQKSKIVAKRAKSRVIKEASEKRDGNSVGILELVESSLEKVEDSKISYSHSDVISPGPKPEVGDIVSHDIIRKSTGKLGAKSVLLDEPSGEKERVSSVFGSLFGKCERETGIVTSVRESFGFINCNDREESLFFPFNQVVNSPANLALVEGKPPSVVEKFRDEPPVEIGALVSFQVVKDTHNSARASNRSVAIKVLRLERKDNKNDSYVVGLESNVEGSILSIPPPPSRSKSRHHSKQSLASQFGRIRYMPKTFVDQKLWSELSSVASGERPSIKIAVRPETNSSDSKKAETEPEKVVHKNVLKLAGQYGGWLDLKFQSIKDEKGNPIGKLISRKDKDSSTENSTKNQSDAADNANGKPLSSSAIAYFIPKDERNRFRVGDRVSFEVGFDKRRFLLLATAVKVTSKASEVASINTERRHGTITGVVACVQEKGFGFLQCVEQDERIFFHLDQCEDPSFKADPAPGDYVEFSIQSSGKGNRAVSLHKLPTELLKPDEIIQDEDKSERRLKGFITREPKDVSKSFPRGDHELAKQIGMRQLSFGNFGKIVVGFPDGTEHEEPDISDSNKTKQKPVAWRRENELQNIVKSFAESDQNILKIEQTLSPLEKKVIVKAVNATSGVYFRKLHSHCAIAKSNADLDEYEEEIENLQVSSSGDEITEEGKDDVIAMSVGAGVDTSTDVPDEKENVKSVQSGSSLAVTVDDTGSERKDSTTLQSYYFCHADIERPKDREWYPTIGDEIEFSLCRNVATKKVRATKITLVNSASKVQRGIVDGALRSRYGFVRPLNAGEGSKGLFSNEEGDVDECFKPGGGGRDGTVRFEVSEIHGGVRLFDGDEVQYTLVINPRTKEAKAVRVKLISRPVIESTGSTERKVVNKELLGKLAGGMAGIAKFHQAKKPDGTNGFAVGRGRNLPIRTVLNPAAKEWTPGFLK